MTFTSAKNPLTILHLERDATFSIKVTELLSSNGVNTKVDEVNSRKQLIKNLEDNSYDLIFLADNAQDSSGMDALKAIKDMRVYTPVVVFSDILDEELIVNYISQGAADFILKTSLDRLTPVVKRVISNSRNTKFVDYQTFFETSPDLLCTFDREGNFAGLNQAWGEVFGFADAELKGKPFVKFVYQDDQKIATAQFQKLLESEGKPVDMTCRFQAHAGDVKWLQWRMKTQKNGSINAVVRDITESKLRDLQITQAHQNLQKLVELYKADIVKKTLVADQIRDSVVVTDLKGVITSWNKGSEKVFGYSPEEVVGKHIAIIYPEKDYKYIQEEATNVLLEHGEKEFELHMLRKSGDVFEARLTLEVTRDSDGKVNGMLGYAIDMGPVRPGSEEPADQVQQPAVDESPESETVESNVEMVSNTNIQASTDFQEKVEEHTSACGAREFKEESKQESVATSEIFKSAIELPAGVAGIATVMYMEDSLANISIIEKILEKRQNYRLITTQEPEDCIDMAKQDLPTIILLDMNLPGCDGYSLLKQIQEDSTLKNIPVIATSMDTSTESKEKARAAGFAGYLVKPIEISGFMAVVDYLSPRNDSGPGGLASSI